MCESGYPSSGRLPFQAAALTSPKHSVALTRLSGRSDLDISQLSALPVDFLVAVAIEVLRSDLRSMDSTSDAAALQAALAHDLSAAPGFVDVFHQSFVNNIDCRMAIHSIASQRVRLVELCLSLPVWGQCEAAHITAMLETLHMKAEHVRDELVSSLLLLCSHYEGVQLSVASTELNSAASLLPGLHGGDKWCEDLFHSLAAFCRVEDNACIMACDSVFHLIMRCLPLCRTPGSQRWCITAAANLCLTDNGRLLFVRSEFVAACVWLSRNSFHAEVDRWLATCVMNILYTKQQPRHFGASKSSPVSREAFETPVVRDMLIGMAQSSHARMTAFTKDSERDAISQAVTSCLSALVNLAINCHLAEPESRLDICVTPEMLRLILFFGTGSNSEDVIEMVAALMRIMAASQMCKQCFSCEPFRDMFIRLLTRRTHAETKLKLLGALVLLFDNNPVPFAQNVELFGDSNFRSAVLGSHLAVLPSSHSLEIVGIMDNVETIKRRCPCALRFAAVDV
jgi:hypothetical protein